MNTNTNRIKQWQEQEALSRFQLIAPLLQEDLDDAKRLQLRKQWIYRCAESACPVFWKSPVRKEEITVPDR